ncbi:hypothetical protein CCU68_23340 [Pseudomonas gingeri NCPPB 3146 = LMG 5327]|uniref:Uncharacterized protein n=1 Tax=Pseudomonas gingeri NCPPB 3146 = LMG 5327 TaxID=707248 RepID=A0ABX4XZW6_9PSED|nr:hypothetical protein CCU68_23340 [Pseudomonas gingeri NCPPB 3146 = LMG 5327]
MQSNSRVIFDEATHSPCAKHAASLSMPLLIITNIMFMMTNPIYSKLCKPEKYKTSEHQKSGEKLLILRTSENK